MKRRMSTVVRIDGHNYKRCTKCRELKLANYDNFPKKLSGFSTWCIPCDRERGRLYRKNGPRRPKRVHRVIGTKDPLNLYGSRGPHQ